MILTAKKLSMLIMNSRKYNPEMLFLLYYLFHVTSFQKIDCKKQASLVFLLKFIYLCESQNFVTSVTISVGHFEDLISFEELKPNFTLTTFP